MGAHVWHSMSYSPDTGLVYIPAQENVFSYTRPATYEHQEMSWNISVNPDAELAELLSLTNALRMTALIEVHDEQELKRVLPMAPRLVGVNNRNLRDFSVNLDTSLRLRPLVAPDVCFVAESGVHTRADMARLAAARVDAVLIGEALVTASDVGAKVQELIDGRQS
jgi:indole-3-glycerol phosphate synthase